MVNVRCPECDSEYVTKNGQKSGKQRYKCKACGKKFTRGVYIKTEKKENKKNNFKERNKPIRSKNKIINIDKLLYNEIKNTEIVMPIILDKKIETAIENDINENIINIEYYKNIIDQLSSEEENEIAHKLSIIEFSEIESLMNKKLFQNNNEKLDALIIKILIDTGEKGMKVLMEYINNLNQYKLTKYNLNVIGKHMSQKLSISWNVIKPYLRNKISINCIYTITRYINYISKLSYRDLKNNLNLEEIRSIYFDKQLGKMFIMDKISDSNYLDNYGEYRFSLSKILKKISKKELINFDYLEQYNNSIFTENNIDCALERAAISVNSNVLSKDIMTLYNQPIKLNPSLTKKGINIIGEQLVIFYKDYCSMEYSCIQKDFDIWLDKFSYYIFKTILQYGIDTYKSFFYDNCESFVFHCKIASKNTEEIAEKICKEYFENPRSDYPDILDKVFENLLYCLNDKAIDTLIYMVDNNIVDIHSTLFQNFAFNFIEGVTEKIYGNFYNIKEDYTYRRINRGGIWEELVGYILREISKNVKYHPALDNNKIPDYAEIVDNKIIKIQECKLVLGFKELKETITKYSPYCNNIEIYCVKNEIDEDIINSEEYNSLIRSVQKDFDFQIKDYNDIYNMTNRYKETLEYFADNVKKTTQKNLLKEKICILFEGLKRDKILYLLDHTFKYSGLFH